MKLRRARIEERPALIELMRRASLVWDDTRADLLARPDLIDLPEAQIVAGQVIVAEEGGLLGFAAILPRTDGDVELDGLFTDPLHFRKGIGTALVGAVMSEAAIGAARAVHVVANRNVLGFYEAVGFRTIGEILTPLGPTACLMVKPVSSP
ncbi:MAG TPA: GNAT family N-acetyltransferase [Devosia sp.]|nr:GNAT family N-acetyltransferase [Devosia sp.]